jgi:hypothetical protein
MTAVWDGRELEVLGGLGIVGEWLVRGFGRFEMVGECPRFWAVGDGR